MRELEVFRKYITEEQSSEQEVAFDKEFLSAANDIAGALEKELKSKDPEQLKEIVGTVIATVLTANALVTSLISINFGMKSTPLFPSRN